MLANIIKVLFSNFIITFVGLVNSFVFPKLMSITGYSEYQTFTLYASYVNILHLGIASGMFVNYGGIPYKKIEKSRYKSEVLLILLVLTFFTGCGFALYGILGEKIILYTVLAIYPVCLIASFKALYQAWDMFTVFSVVNTAPTLMITVIALLIYAFSKNLTSDRLIGIYLAVNYIATFGICGWFFKSTRGVKSGKLFSRENIETTKVGFLITVGNYISLLFHAVDKQFVKIFFTDYDFAMYSFSVSTQTIMTVFITALAQPFYPKMANNTIKNEEYNIMKELLFLFGSMSGVAYFAISFIVKHFIPNYVDSIKIVAMFFAVFPAMAVINVIYINMYKITKQMKKYISTLSLMLVLAVVFNYAAVLLKGSYVGIALATMLVYYFWLFYSAKDFEYINIGKKDIVYLLGYFAAYFICTRMLGEIAGIIIYASFMLLWGRLLYGKSMSYLLDIIRNKVHV